jgi:multidrug resistance protein
MVGLLMVIPLLPFFAQEMGGGGVWVGLLVSAYALAQLLSAPLWGRVSDRYGRRPALLVSLTAAAAAYVVFAFATSLWVLLLSRLVQGAGGGTVGVLQAYVADATEPQNRARSLGWLSAATSVGVTIGPVLGSTSLQFGRPAPGLLAAGLCLLNMAFAWAYLPETNLFARTGGGGSAPIRPRAVAADVLRAPRSAAPRLIWIYSIGMGAFAGYTAVLALFLDARFGVTEFTIGYIFMWAGVVSVLARAVLLGRLVDWLGEARLARFGQALLGVGLLAMPATWRLDGRLLLGAASVEWRWIALMGVITLVPLGTAFTFPCVTALLSKVIDPRSRGVVMGVQQSFGGAARVVAPLWAGWAFDHLGTGFPFWTSAALVLATLLLTFGIDPADEHTPAWAPAPAA